MSIPESHQKRSLLLLGGVWLLVGVLTLINPPTLPSEAFLLAALPIWIRAAFWLLAGSCAMLFSVWPPDKRRWGFVALLLPAGLRTLAYVWGGVEWGLTAAFADVAISSPRAWLGALIWALVTLFVMHESTAVDPPKVGAP